MNNNRNNSNSNTNNYFKINVYDTFFGTEHYYRQPFSNIVLTDGAEYISGNGLGWLIDEIIYNKDIIKNEFTSITLKAENNKGIITWMDDKEIQHKKFIEYTDFFGEITLFLTSNVLMLKSEY